MKDFQLVRYCGDGSAAPAMLRLWCLGWLDMLRGFIRVVSLGALDSDAKIWFLARTKLTTTRYEHAKDLPVL